MNLVITNDGSHTLFIQDINEHYHSTYGAITESQHIFIEAGLKALHKKKETGVFEVGFGTGLNALLTCIHAFKSPGEIIYYTLEKNPVDPSLAAQLNYPQLLNESSEAASFFQAIHLGPWDKLFRIHDRFQLCKIHGDLVTFSPDFSYDLIYFDAFSPGKQPEMWTPGIFSKLYEGLNEEGILTTYCVKGDVRRAMKHAGFEIEKLPGPPGKRVMLRGRKIKSL